MDNQPDPKDTGPSPKNLLLPYVVVVAIFLLFYIFFYQAAPRESSYEIPYSEFKAYLEEDRIDKITMQGDALHGMFFEEKSIGPKGEKSQRFSTRIPSFGDDSLLPALEQHRVQVQVKKPAGDSVGGINYFSALLPWLIFFLIFFWLIRRASKRMGGGIGGPSELKRFLETPHKEAKIPEITFADVAGQEEAKKRTRGSGAIFADSAKIQQNRGENTKRSTSCRNAGNRKNSSCKSDRG